MRRRRTAAVCEAVTGTLKRDPHPSVPVNGRRALS